MTFDELQDALAQAARIARRQNAMMGGGHG